MSDLVTEIAAGASDQARGIERITKAMEQMSALTQQNAANSEESSSAASELDSQAQRLAATVASFKLAEGATSTARSLAIRSSDGLFRGGAPVAS